MQSPVWPGDTPFQSEPHFTIGPELAVNVNAIQMTGHIGAHIDAPRHVEDDAADITLTSIDSCIGAATVLHLHQRPSDAPIGLGEVLDRLATLEIPQPEPRLILRRYASELTHWDDKVAGLDPELVIWAGEQGIKLIGTDLMSFDCHNSKSLPSHHAAIAGGIVMLEGLNLTNAPEGNHHLIALPLNIVGADASPVRAVLTVTDSTER